MVMFPQQPHRVLICIVGLLRTYEHTWRSSIDDLIRPVLEKFREALELNSSGPDISNIPLLQFDLSIHIPRVPTTPMDIKYN